MNLNVFVFCSESSTNKQMKCARLHLRERSRAVTKTEKIVAPEKPRRYCQKRMVNPEHDEDPRWTDILARFHCNKEDNFNCTHDHIQAHHDDEDLYLSVQTLKFQGDVKQRKRPKSSFKYKTPTDTVKHRMFVKQVVDDENDDADRSSQLTCYYFDDYLQYINNNDKSRPTSGKSTLFLQGLSNVSKENKGTQVDITANKKSRIVESKTKSLYKKILKENEESNESTIQDAKVTYKKSGRRKSLTISRAQSPETVQVIRVDVVCNNRSNSTISDHEDTKKVKEPLEEIDSKIEREINASLKHTHFGNKYLLTNTVKTLDENLSGGATKVTLLCKTFKLSNRSKLLEKPKMSDTKVIKVIKEGKFESKKNCTLVKSLKI